MNTKEIVLAIYYYYKSNYESAMIYSFLAGFFLQSLSNLNYPMTRKLVSVWLLGLVHKSLPDGLFKLFLYQNIMNL